MGFGLTIFLFVLVLVFGGTLALYRVGHKWLARVLGGLLSLAVMLFCVFGFLATYEPLPEYIQNTWRTIYIVTGTASAAFFTYLLWPKKLMQ